MRERLVIVALVLFVAVDVLLVAVAVRHVQSPPDSPGSSPPSAVSPTPSPTTAAVSRTPTPAPTPVGPPVSYLSIGADRTLLRSGRGACVASTKLEVGVSNDGGKSFDERRVPGLHEILGLRAISRHDLTVIGRDSRCRLGHYTSDDDGRTWTRRPGGDATWHLSPARGARTVASPAGKRDTPCVPSAVSTISHSVARLLCRGGGILGTADAGKTWVSLGSLVGAVDIRFTTPGDGVALARRPRCPAAVMRTVDGGATWSPRGCVPGTRPRAIASERTVVAAQVGTHLFLSTDGGKTWPKSAGG